MKKSIQLLISICATFVLSGTTAGMAENLKIMTEEYPPFNYTENGKLTGLATEVVLGVAEKLGNTMDIEVLPWARAYAILQQQDGLILYSMTRTESREELFKWVGPVASNKWVFFTKKGSGITLASIDDARKAGNIGTYKDDAAEMFLKEQGFTNLDSVIDDEQNVPKLMAGRINLWIVDEMQGIHKAKVKGVADQLEKVLDVKDTLLYIAFSKNTPDEVIARWQAAVDEMKTDGSYEALAKKYL
jgi:polar amino acid transport system substrate-binding protein